MLVSRAETRLPNETLISSSVLTTRPVSDNSQPEPETDAKTNGIDKPSLKVSFSTVGRIPVTLSLESQVPELVALPASNSHEVAMSRFLKLARNFNSFYLRGDLRQSRPLVVCGQQVGLVRPVILEAITRHPEAFLVDPASGSVWVHPALQTYEDRSAKVDAVLRQWREEGLFLTLKGWRDECYEVRTGFGDPPLMKMERSATCLFGIRQYGVDINGYTRCPKLGFSIWLQKRAHTKPTWPGKWDNMVGGGLSVGHSVLETALKEAAEEASIPPQLLLNLKSAGSVSFYFESERGLFPNTEFVYDLELPPDFVPCNADGEVESFELVPVSQVMERILAPDFKTTSCPVTLDFLIRHGFVKSDNEPHLPELIELLHVPLHLLYSSGSSSLPAP